MVISLERKHNPRTPDALIAEGYTVFAAAAVHLWRTTDLTLKFSSENMSAGALSVLFSDVPCAMPHLRNLEIAASGLAETDIPSLNVACPRLRSVELRNVFPLSEFSFFGESTTVLHLRSLPLRLGVLRRILELSPNLQEFSVSFCGIHDDHVGSQTGLPLAMRLVKFHVFDVPLPDLLLLQSLSIPVARIQEVVLNTASTEIPADVAYDFLRIGDLVDIKCMYLETNSLAVSTTAGYERIMHCALRDLNFLDDLFSAGAISAPLRELTVTLEVFMDLITLISAARDAPALPRLEKLTVWVSQESFRRDDGVVHGGPAILAPSLTLIEVLLHGGEIPTAKLVRHFIACMACIKAASLTDAGFTISDRHNGGGDSHLHRFGELFREETRRFQAGVPHQQ